MNNQTSIKYISSLLDSPGSVTDGDQSSISLFRQTFPYFVPVRYLLALESHKKAPFSPQMLSGIQPYMGDWISFSEFLTEGCKPIDSQLAAVNKVVDKKNAEIHRHLTEHEVVSVAQTAPLVPSAVVVEKKEDKIPLPEIVAAKAVEQAPPIAEQKKEEVVAEPVAVSVPAVEEPVELASTAPIAAVKEEIAQAAEVVNIPRVEVEQPIPIPVPAQAVDQIKEADIPVAPTVSVPVFEETQIPEAYVQGDEAPVLVEFFVNEEGAAPIETAAQYAEPVSAPSAEAPENAIEEDAIIEVAPENAATAEAPVTIADTIAEAVEIVNEPGSYAETPDAKGEDQLIFPIYTKDYFLQQGEKISDEIPLEINELKDGDTDNEVDKSLMVVMSFSEWLLHFKNSSEKQKEESKDQKALKTMWQKEKLAAAMEEENEEIPENVFEMAVNSISKEEGLVSETLAEIYIKQGKYDKAVEMYRKLSLKNPQKNAYFAHKIDEALKDKQS